MRFLLLKLVHKEGKKKYSPQISSKEGPLMRFLLQKLVHRAKKSTVPRLVVRRGL